MSYGYTLLLLPWAIYMLVYYPLYVSGKNDTINPIPLPSLDNKYCNWASDRIVMFV